MFICVCIALCTIVAHNTAQNRPEGRAEQEGHMSHRKPMPLFPRGSLQGQMEEKKPGKLAKPRFTWKTAIKLEVAC